MEYLYVCHFSNGHIKVGRSIDPQSRIAAHVDRVACVGIELVEHHVVGCVGHSHPAEAALIERCADAAKKRNKSEWFEGLDYLCVCEWSNVIAAEEFPLSESLGFKTYYFALTPEGREKFAGLSGTSPGMLAQVAYGHKEIELGFADVLVAKGGGNFDLDGLPLTERAKKQRALREAPVADPVASGA